MSTLTANAEPEIGSEDHPLERVPDDERVNWLGPALQRFGTLASFGQFLMAGVIGMAMGFREAMLAYTIGSVLLFAVTIGFGFAGQREGLTTAVLVRWAGFGRWGSVFVGLALTMSLAGWFAVQNELFAQNMHTIFPGIEPWNLALLAGAGVTFVVVMGFHWMNAIAWIFAPLYAALLLWSTVRVLGGHDLGSLLDQPPHGTPMSLATGATIVTGGFIVGAVMTPDTARYSRGRPAVVGQSMVGVVFTQYFVGVLGVLVSQAVNMADYGQMVALLTSWSALAGALMLMVSVVQVNNWNLYSSSVGIVGAIDSFADEKFDRPLSAMALAAVGTVMSARGFASHFEGFLAELGVLFPPIAAIVLADYYVLRTWRDVLDASRERGELPAEAPNFVPAGAIAWVLGYAVSSQHLLGRTLDFGVPAFNAFLVAFVVYVVCGRFGLAGRPRA